MKKKNPKVLKPEIHDPLFSSVVSFYGGVAGFLKKFPKLVAAGVTPQYVFNWRQRGVPVARLRVFTEITGLAADVLNFREASKFMKTDIDSVIARYSAVLKNKFSASYIRNFYKGL